MRPKPHRPSPRHHRALIFGSGAIVAVVFSIAALSMLPATALGQVNPGPTATSTSLPSVAATSSPTPVAAPALKLSTNSGLAGAAITANGSGFKAGETVEVTFNGAAAGTPTVNDGGTFSLAFTIPTTTQPGQYALLARGQSSGFSATTSFTVNQGSASLTFSLPQAAPGTALTVLGSGFRPGETVQLSFNGPVVGSSTADTNGQFSVTFTLPPLSAGSYNATATGETSRVEVTVAYTVTAGPSPAPAAPTPTPTPTPVAQPAPAPQPAPAGAPAMTHDDRYFAQTGYRIDNDQVWGFFRQYGGLSTFGYPVSRNLTFLGCPVQMFQRQVIQVCAGQAAALINLLDPEIFPYTQVNGSTFPAADTSMKNTTPQVGSPTYAEDINKFIQDNVPESFAGQPVNFFTTFNTLGGLTIWGAPISQPQPDPANSNFIYQRFQRGIMHFIAGSGTQSILLADYLKAIMINQNVPPDLLQQARETRYFNQYCPGQTAWMCRPAELPGTDLTYAFEAG